jgi:hypothetical protein
VGNNLRVSKTANPYKRGQIPNNKIAMAIYSDGTVYLKQEQQQQQLKNAKCF